MTIALLPLSLFIGIAASAIGFTAWPLIVPILYIICGFDLYLTLFSSLLVDCGNALVITLIAIRHRQIDIHKGLLLAVFALIWIAGGIALGKVFIPGNEDFFRGSAGIIAIIIGISFVIKGIKNKSTRGSIPGPVKENSNPTVLNKAGGRFRRYMIYSGVALMAFHIGFFGIGGGMGYAISLMLFLSYPVLKATGTAMLMTFCSTLFAASVIFFQIPAGAFVQVDAAFLVPVMIVLSMTGTYIGAKIAYSLPENKINILIGSIVILAGLLASAQKYVLQIISS